MDLHIGCRTLGLAKGGSDQLIHWLWVIPLVRIVGLANFCRRIEGGDSFKVTTVLFFKTHEVLLSMTSNLRAIASTNVSLNWAPIFLKEIHALNKKTMLFVSPAPMQASVFALLLWGRALTHLGAICSLRHLVEELTRWNCAGEGSIETERGVFHWNG